MELIFHRRPALLLKDMDQVSQYRRLPQLLSPRILGGGVKSQFALDAKDKEQICKIPAGGSYLIFPSAHRRGINYLVIWYEGFAIVLGRTSAESQS